MERTLSFSITTFTSDSVSRVAPKAMTHGAVVGKLLKASSMSTDSPYIKTKQTQKIMLHTAYMNEELTSKMDRRGCPLVLFVAKYAVKRSIT